MDAVMDIVSRVARLLIAKGWSLGIAESCTGGLVSDCITNLSGSSTFFVGGVVAYSNEVKSALLGVPAELLASRGAVSAEVALAMAQGVRRLLRCDVGIATTGIAGPTGGTPQKPVGTVFIAACSPVGERVEHHRWSADRIGNKRLSAQAVLGLLASLLEGSNERHAKPLIRE